MRFFFSELYWETVQAPVHPDFQPLKTVVLAGGHGRRFQIGDQCVPKPLAEIGGKPLVRHVMEIFSDHGFTEFVLALGHGGPEVRDYFYAHAASSWTLRLCDTGLETGSAGRLRRISTILRSEERFLLTYCDGLADIDLRALLRFHLSHGRQVTMTTVHPPQRFGIVSWDGDAIAQFREKPPDSTEWINGGFFVVERSVLDSIASDSDSWERDVLPALAVRRELMGFRHEGFFAAVDTPKDRDAMEALWAGGNAPWRRLCSAGACS